jgi:hypothetical protein
MRGETQRSWEPRDIWGWPENPPKGRLYGRAYKCTRNVHIVPHFSKHLTDKSFSNTFWKSNLRNGSGVISYSSPKALTIALYCSFVSPCFKYFSIFLFACATTARLFSVVRSSNPANVEIISPLKLETYRRTLESGIAKYNFPVVVCLTRLCPWKVSATMQVGNE